MFGEHAEPPLQEYASNYYSRSLAKFHDQHWILIVYVHILFNVFQCVTSKGVRSNTLAGLCHSIRALFRLFGLGVESAFELNRHCQ
jgi:hypothetical protein